MGILILTFKSESSPVGFKEIWPQNLLDILCILLNSKFPFFSFCGNIFYYKNTYQPNWEIITNTYLYQALKARQSGKNSSY